MRRSAFSDNFARALSAQDDAVQQLFVVGEDFKQ